MKLLFFIATIFLTACGNYIPFGNEVYLVRPVNIKVEALSERRFSFTYFVQNQELSFDGYNLYISRTPIPDGEIYSYLTSLSRDGGLPTFRHSPKDFNPNDAKNIILTHYTDTVTKFEPEIQYYFRMTAHSRVSAGGIESQPSNEVAGIALP